MRPDARTVGCPAQTQLVGGLVGSTTLLHGYKTEAVLQVVNGTV
ncbi:Unknown protein sequence [Pseudomonas amygdali pv. sesami]|nr:Unknown protein sequence [Pseudomonas amygdali pv. sesami]